MRGLFPSVTEILAAVGLDPDLSMVKPEVLAWASARGTALHRAIELYTKGTLDTDSLHPEIAGALTGYLKFVADSGHEAIASELELIDDKRWGFMGHPDRIGTHRGLDGGLAVYDWKMVASFDANYVRLQTAGYAELWNINHPDRPVAHCFGLHLKKDGSYRLHNTSDLDARQTFLAALTVYKAQRRK